VGVFKQICLKILYHTAAPLSIAKYYLFFANTYALQKSPRWRKNAPTGAGFLNQTITRGSKFYLCTSGHSITQR
jgi:hypothetical protein